MYRLQLPKTQLAGFEGLALQVVLETTVRKGHHHFAAVSRNDDVMKAFKSNDLCPVNR